MSRFLSYIHNLRGVAILFVVGVHARGNMYDWSSHPESHKLIATIFDAQEGNGTVMFLFIAGFLFQHLQQHSFQYGRYLKQKFKVIILPYILISIPIIIFRIAQQFHPWSASDDFTSNSWAYQFFYYLVTGTHMSPFWFISAIILFYFATPILHWLDKPWFYKYVFPILLLAGFFTFRSEHNGNPVLSYLHYLPVYVAGMWASRYKKEIFSMDLRYFWILTAIYLAISVAEFSSGFGNLTEIDFEDVLSDGVFIFNWYILRALILCFMFAMLFYRLQFAKMPALELLAEYSFGIFFVHFILIIASRKLIEMIIAPVNFSLLTFTIFLSAIVLLSTVAVFCIKKITGPYSRHLIGS